MWSFGATTGARGEVADVRCLSGDFEDVDDFHDIWSMILCCFLLGPFQSAMIARLALGFDDGIGCCEGLS